jgi:hypothetical protein
MEPAAGFPHFVGNRKDPLFMFTDAAFHRACFLEHPLRESVERRLEWRKRWRKERKCFVCGEEVKETEDEYKTQFLTDDPNSPLYEFNYLHFHRAHLLLWPRLAEFRRLVEDSVASGKYEGPPILPE